MLTLIIFSLSVSFLRLENILKCDHQKLESFQVLTLIQYPLNNSSIFLVYFDNQPKRNILVKSIGGQ